MNLRDDAQYQSTIYDTTTLGKTPVTKYYVVMLRSNVDTGDIFDASKEVLSKYLLNVNNTVILSTDSLIMSHVEYNTRRQQILERKVNQQQELHKLLVEFTLRMSSVSDYLIDKYILDGYNIIIDAYNHSLTWTVKEIDRLKSHGYKIIFASPLSVVSNWDTNNVDQTVQNTSVTQYSGVLLGFVDRFILIDGHSIVLDLEREYSGSYIYNILGVRTTCNVCKIRKSGYSEKVRRVLGDQLYQDIIIQCKGSCT